MTAQFEMSHARKSEALMPFRPGAGALAQPIHKVDDTLASKHVLAACAQGPLQSDQPSSVSNLVVVRRRSIGGVEQEPQ